ncbi:MAG: TonB family protein [Bacteroidales bacterium]|nr:TonB family protein [Bacteroidales bacterium]
MEWDNRAALLTAGFYTLVLILLIFFGFTTKLPLPDEQGILVNFGDSETGFGRIEPKAVEKVVRQQEATRPQETVKENPLTQDYDDDAPAIKPVKKTEQPAVKKEEPQKVQEDKPKEEKPVIDTRAIFGRNTRANTSGSEGETSGAGNQGSQTGDVNSANHSLGGGQGTGITANLTGRSPLALPSPEFNIQKEGKVVIQITVDRTGKVVNAVPIAKGSTTLDSYLQEVARKAALNSRFNSDENALVNQTGTIEYVFRLR